jgi:hypothetical protein
MLTIALKCRHIIQQVLGYARSPIFSKQRSEKHFVTASLCMREAQDKGSENLYDRGFSDLRRLLRAYVRRAPPPASPLDRGERAGG